MQYSGFAIGIRMKLPELSPEWERECLARAVAAVPEGLRDGLILHGGMDSTAAPEERIFLAVLSGGGIKRMRKVAAALRQDAQLAPFLAQTDPFIQNNRLGRTAEIPCYGVLPPAAVRDGALAIPPWKDLRNDRQSIFKEDQHGVL